MLPGTCTRVPWITRSVEARSAAARSARSWATDTFGELGIRALSGRGRVTTGARRTTHRMLRPLRTSVCEHRAMRACVMRDGHLVVDDLPDPRPGPGQLLVRTVACGI